MAKKETKTLIPPYAALAALKEHDEKLSLLLNILPDAIRFIKEPEIGNDNYRNILITTLEGNFAAVMEYRRSELTPY